MLLFCVCAWHEDPSPTHHVEKWNCRSSRCARQCRMMIFWIHYAWATQDLSISRVLTSFFGLNAETTIKRERDTMRRISKGWGHISAHPYLLAYALSLSSPLDLSHSWTNHFPTHTHIHLSPFFRVICIFSSCTVHLTQRVSLKR